jgi:hypothetical protein
VTHFVEVNEGTCKIKPVSQPSVDIVYSYVGLML